MDDPPAQVHAPGERLDEPPLLVVFASPIPIGASHESKRKELRIE